LFYGSLPDDLLADAAEDAMPLFELAPDTLINVQFSSGTTGLAKGCIPTHR